MAEVRLVLEAGIDDHLRPRHPLWQQVIPPLSQVALWLWQDGTVLMKDHLPEEWEDQPDDVVGGGHDWRGQDTDWQATVLTNAGYTLVPI
jgi:hypothetical protein